MTNTKLIKNRNLSTVLKAILFCVVFTGIFIIFSFAKTLLPELLERFGYGLLGILAGFLTTFIFLIIDKRSFASIGLKFEISSIPKFLLGTLIGIVLMGILTFSVIYFSDFKIETNNNSSVFHFLIGTVAYIPMAFMEELGFRAYPLVTIQEKSGSRAAIIITSILFGLYHIVNGWTIQNAMLGAGVWGIIYGLAAVYSKGIALPTGIHYAANMTTDAFGISGDSFNLWIMKQQNGDALVNYQAGETINLVLQILLLVFGLTCMLVFTRKKLLNI